MSHVFKCLIQPVCVDSCVGLKRSTHIAGISASASGQGQGLKEAKIAIKTLVALPDRITVSWAELLLLSPAAIPHFSLF